MSGIACLDCGSPTDVKDSRPIRDTVRRRRICSTCGRRFNTFEINEAMYRRLMEDPADFTMRALIRIRNEALRAIEHRKIK